MIDTPSALVRRIHDSGRQVVIVVTGGGSRAISALLEQPGASRTVLEASVPYSAEALTAWLGARPEQFCSERTARAMAMVAYQRAVRYASNHGEIREMAGIGCTASLVSDRPKHGEHRIHVALQTASETQAWSMTLVKGARDRRQEEDVAAGILLNAVAKHAGLDEPLDLRLFESERLEEARCAAPAEWQQLLSGAMTAIPASPNSSASAPKVIFPGAFNPLHDAHRKMARIASRRLAADVAFEISITNVDKPPLDFIEMRTRADQFTDASLWFTRAPTFVEKAAIFPGATFVVGADTLRRIAEARYYGDDSTACLRAIDTIASRGCRFLVFGRRTGEEVETLGTLSLPESLSRISDEVPVDEFLLHVSSTALRVAADERHDE
ncbi:MAG TPA: hypothetical protein VHV77_16050 [Pirellulales bacterium]|nr:hypothetical protein [Pirellulales bacterium]